MSDTTTNDAFPHRLDARAVEIFRSDPMRSLSACDLVADLDNSSPNWTTGHYAQGAYAAVFEMASSAPDRFLEFLSYFPPLIQDVFLQYCILGRTQSQIAETLNIRQSPEVWRALRWGVDAISAILAWGSDPTKMNGHAAAASYRSLLAWRSRSSSTSIRRIHAPRNLGSFHVEAADPNLSEFFVHRTQQREH